MMIGILISALLVLKLRATVSDASSKSVLLKDGTLFYGTREENALCFKGIRYAQPPIGDLRWTPPVMYSYPDVGETVVNATSYGSHCMQSVWPNGSEDCLFLNVFTGANREESQRLVPVLIFIHGGSYVSGSAKFYSGADIVNYWAEEVVVVTVDYRLNVFGFLGAEELRSRDKDAHSTGNYGLQDQRMAFEWVRQNIESFGGNASHITIMGESAGGGSVSNHLTMKKTWEYFTGAIIESGSFTQWTTQTMQRAQSMYKGLLDTVGCADVDCLLRQDTDTLFNANVAYSDDDIYLSPYVPTADGVEMMTHTWLAAASGDVADVPILHGTNADEGVLFTALSGRRRVNMSELRGFWSDQKYTTEEIAELTRLYVVGKEYEYPVSGHDALTTTEWWALQRSTGDGMFSCPAKHLSEQLTVPRPGKLSRKSNTYFYHFEYGSLISSYTVHGAELPYAFHWKLGLFSDESLANLLSSYWGNFVTSSDHNPNAGVVGMESIPDWPAYVFQDDNLLVLSEIDNVHVLSGLKERECRFHIRRIDASIKEAFENK